LVENEVCCTPSVKNSTTGFFMSKSFLSQHLFNEDGDDPIKLLKGEHLNKVMDDFMPLCFPNICNLVVLFKRHSTNRGYIDKILLFKSKSRYNYIQDNCFLRQLSNQKVFFFKMSIDGVPNGVDLVKRMQLGGDLENAWIMLDHFKQIERWSIMYSMSHLRPYVL